MPQTLMAFKLRSVLGEMAIATDTLKRIPQTPLVAESVARLEKAYTTLLNEAALVEGRKTPTLKFGNDLLEHVINLECVKDFLQSKDQDET